MDIRKTLIVLAVMALPGAREAAAGTLSARSDSSVAVPPAADSAAVYRRPADIGISIGSSDGALKHTGAALGLFSSTDVLRGAQVGALTSVTGTAARGVSIGGFGAMSHGPMYGVQMAGVMNSVGGSLRGVQVSGVVNMAHEANGVQLSMMTNVCTTPFRGVQLAGITNISMGVRRGMQVAAAANVCSSYMRGIQAAAYNYADTLNGSQIGLFNFCVSHPRGVQVGLINYSRDTVAHKIGLVNVNPRTRIDLMVYGGSSAKTNVAVRFRNRSTYSIIGFGTHYMGLDEKFSGTVFYRIGQYFRIARALTLSGDVGYFHVETFEEHSDAKPARLYSLQGRVNLDLQINRTVGAFVSCGYGDTRHYYHSRRYRDRMIFEAGVTLRGPRKPLPASPKGR